MCGLILVYLINWILLSTATVCDPYYTNGNFFYMQSDDNVEVQYLEEPELEGDCISVSYSIYNMSNNNDNSIIFYVGDYNFVCKYYCNIIIDCVHMVDGKINMHYYTSFNESFSYSLIVEYNGCHMSEGEILAAIFISVIFGVLIFAIIFMFVCTIGATSNSRTEITIINPEQQVKNLNSENADDSNMFSSLYWG